MGLVQDLASAKKSPEEVLQHYLDRIDRHNKTLNAYISVESRDPKEALKSIQDKKGKKLYGVPVAIKDNINVKGWEFIGGLDEWAVMAGLLVDGAPAVGAIGMPDGTVFWGWVGGAVFCDDEPLTMPPHDSLDTAVVIHSHSRRESNRDAVKRLGAGRTAQAGGAGYKAVQVLLGNAHIYVHARGGTKWWDSVAPAALITAAGGHAGNATVFSFVSMSDVGF